MIHTVRTFQVLNIQKLYYSKFLRTYRRHGGWTKLAWFGLWIRNFKKVCRICWKGQLQLYMGAWQRAGGAWLRGLHHHHHTALQGQHACAWKNLVSCGRGVKRVCFSTPSLVPYKSAPGIQQPHYNELRWNPWVRCRSIGVQVCIERAQ